MSRGVFLAMVLIGASGCGGGGGATPEKVVVYCALDREFSEPILTAYGEAAGVEVAVKYDVESTKTVALTNALILEADRPRCDLFWNNEIVNTIRLKDKGLLVPFTPKHQSSIPAAFRAQDGTWYGFAARARILLVNTMLVTESMRPKGMADLADGRWSGRAGIAKPLFGTTATHAACLFSVWGDEKAKDYFRSLKANKIRILSGNKQVADAVGAGDLAFGLTDTDDAMGVIREGKPVVIVYPDRAAGELGTLFIPNTIALIKNSPHPDAGRALADHLLGPEVEATLAAGPSAQIPLLTDTRVEVQVETPKTVTPMAVDFEAAARVFDRAAAFLASEFVNP